MQHVTSRHCIQDRLPLLPVLGQINSVHTFISILSFHLCRTFPSCCYPSCFPTKISYATFSFLFWFRRSCFIKKTKNLAQILTQISTVKMPGLSLHRDATDIIRSFLRKPHVNAFFQTRPQKLPSQFFKIHYIIPPAKFGDIMYKVVQIWPGLICV